MREKEERAFGKIYFNSELGKWKKGNFQENPLDLSSCPYISNIVHSVSLGFEYSLLRFRRNSTSMKEKNPHSPIN